jgi:uncharacterized membrane protein YhaH (DUF805 family)
MTTWEPYPTASTATAPAVDYEPYPSVPDSSVRDGSAPQMTPYLAYVDPYASSVPRPSVTPQQAIKLAVKNARNATGRASRSEFWWPALGLFIVQWVARGAMATAVDAAQRAGAFAAVGYGLLGFMLLLVWLAAVVPLVTLGIRRLHDTDRSGWLMALALIPGIGAFIAAILLAQDSKPSGARYDKAGSLPHGPEAL